MSDLDLKFYISVFLRRLPLMLAVAASVFALSVAVAYCLPLVYKASAKILVEAPEISPDLARSTVPIDSVAQLQIMQEQVSTRENLLALADRLHASPSGASSDQIVDDLRARTTFELVKAADTPVNKGAVIFRISFAAADPKLSADVVNELASFILNKNARLRTDRAGDTSAFFSKEASDLANEIAAVDAKILAFKKANVDALPDNLDFRRSQLQNAQDRLLALGREASTLRSRRDALAQMKALKNGFVTAGALTLDQQVVQELKRQLAEQLAVFAETSPNIAALRERIAALEERAEREAAANAKNGVARGISSEIDLQLFEADERLASIALEQKGLTADIDKAGALIAATPENETALNGLSRTREDLQGQYSAVLARRAEAATGRQIELLSKGERFSLVEPAAPPSEPASPKRDRIIAAGAAGGIAAGLGLVVLLEILTKTLRRPADLVSLLQVQPLAIIPDIQFQRPKSYSPFNNKLKYLTVILLILAAFLSEILTSSNKIQQFSDAAIGSYDAPS